MHFRPISAKIQLKNMKQHFNWEAGPLGPTGYALAILNKLMLISNYYKTAVHKLTYKQLKSFFSTLIIFKS